MSRKPNNSRQTRALLTALLDRSQTWRHGYDLAKETGLKSGTLYPLLIRLSEQGLLESRWQEAERPGLPPHGEKVAVGSMSWYRFVEGKIVEDWGTEVFWPTGTPEAEIGKWRSGR